MGYSNDHLKVRWLSEIPHCAFQCLYPPALEGGCSYSDFSCICLAISNLAGDPETKACISACPVNPDQRWAPSRILEFCDLVGENIQLPEYMNQFSGMHRRAGVGPIPSYTDDGSVDSITGTVTYYPTVYNVGIQTYYITMTATGSPTLSPTSASSESAPAAIDDNSTSSGLSVGAKVGIGVGIPLVVIIISLFFFWFLRKQRSKRINSAPETDHINNIPELSEQTWARGPLPAEADSNALHEPDSISVTPAKVVAAGVQNSMVYELSGNSIVQHPPSVSSSPKRTKGNSADERADATFEGIDGRANLSTTSASETNHSGFLSDSLGASTDTSKSKSPQRFQENVSGKSEQLPASFDRVDVPLSQLEAEMALIAEEKERLQQLQSLAEREAELKRQIMARKSGL